MHSQSLVHAGGFCFPVLAAPGSGCSRAGGMGQPRGRGLFPPCPKPLGLLQTKALIDKLQKLVSSEGRFKNLREALKK